jgi:hypothetical protein
MPAAATLPRNQGAACQSPAADTKRARAGGSMTCPRFEPCTIKPFVVPSCRGAGACRGKALKIEVGSTPPQAEKARQAR